MRRLAPPLLVTGLLCTALTLRASVMETPVFRPAPDDARSEDRALQLPTDFNALVDKYCVECHNDKSKKGNMSLAHFDIAKVAENAELGEKMVRKLRTGLMPPKRAE